MFEWTQLASFRGKGDLANQLQRAALSISNNIAEGFERGSTKELLNYLYIARGSAGEVRSMLCVMERMNGFADLRSADTNVF
jgi:four helix bundle protein